jgi:PAS domain S-box-containing protein
MSIVAKTARTSIPTRTRSPRQPIEAALTKFASDLSPAKGQQFFDLLVEYVTATLGFDGVVVGEFTTGGTSRFIPIAQHFPADATARAIVKTHCDKLATAVASPGVERADDGCMDVSLIGTDGRAIGAICGFGKGGSVDATMRILFGIIAHRAAAELEHQRAQRALERRDALFIGLIAEAHDVVGVIDASGAFTAVSPAIERVLGYTAASCVGMPVIELVHTLDRPAVEALLGIQASHGYSIEARLQKKDGAWVTMDISYAEHEDLDGRRIKVVSARDLTDQRRLEDRLRQSQKTEIIGRLATGIAHDFSNILMVVRSHAEIMRLGATAGDPRQSCVDAINDAVERGADLARQLLAFSRHREFEMKRVDLNAAIEQSASLLRRLVGSSIKLDTNLSHDARYIAADATQIEQVVLNLTLNARDAMPGGGRITFTTAPVVAGGPLPPVVEDAPDTYVCFSVIDTGCGIREDVLPHIFEPLFTTKQDGSGTGIGLATVHDIVMRHGGSIEVASTEGQGTTFRIYLPRNAAPTRKT